MTLRYDTVRNWRFPPVEVSYDEKDCMLYALSVGFGHDPTDEGELRFVYEKDLRTVPTMPVVLGWPGFWMKDPATGIDWTRILHGEQSITVHRPLPTAGTVVCQTRVTGIVDKGAGKGAVVLLQRLNSDKATGELVTTIDYSIFCRGDGGFGPGDPAPPPPPRVPDVEPEAICDLRTLPQQALFYRLSADRAAHHADPAAARAAGFDRPFLHGLCTYAIAGRAVLRHFCQLEPEELKTLSARFSSPVFPGDTLRTEMWRRASTVHFRCRALERNVVVLDHGCATLAQPIGVRGITAPGRTRS